MVTEMQFHLATTSEAHLRAVEELTEEIQAVGMLIGNLVHSIRAYSFANSQMRMLMTGDLDKVISALPRPPRGLLVRQQIQNLHMDIANLYEEKKRVFGRCFRVLIRGEGDGEEEEEEERGRGRGRIANGDMGLGLEGLWEIFMQLEDEEKRGMASQLKGKCTLMRIFALLSALRTGIEELLGLDEKISIRLQQEFEGVLVELREFDGCERGDGVNQGIGGSASMQWRVLSLVERKRKDELRTRMEDVKRGRGRVSVALLGVVEGLAEDGGEF